MDEAEIDILREEVEILKAKLNKLLESKNIEKTVSTIDARLDKLEKRVARSAETGLKLEKAIVDSIEMIKAENVEIIDRIVNIEFKLFPNLASDLVQLHGVIGDTDAQKGRPHERRKP